jgi:hypothetical protein
MQQPQQDNPIVGEVLRNSSATRSTGPRTPTGKERRKLNATKHGIFSAAAVIKSESQEEFQSLQEGFRASLRPEGVLEDTLVEKLATLFWRYRRLLGSEVSELPNRLSGDILIRHTRIEFLGRDHLLRYEATLERGIERTFNQLERLQ